MSLTSLPLTGTPKPVCLAVPIAITVPSLRMLDFIIARVRRFLVTTSPAASPIRLEVASSSVVADYLGSDITALEDIEVDLVLKSWLERCGFQPVTKFLPEVMALAL